jgi:structural maintenance of chromosome 2
MAYVFGCGFVCKDDAAAKKVAFNKDVMMNCVTLAGDLFNPSGTLTGGARAKGNSVLLRLNALVVRPRRRPPAHGSVFPCFLPHS